MSRQRVASRQRPPAGKELLIDGVRLRYIDRGSGPVLLLVHGFASSIEISFGRLLPLLPSSYRIIAADLAGCGYSDRRTDVDMGVRAQADRLLALLAHLDVSCVTVVGLSLGGAIALHMADLAPERVERLILLSAVDAGSWSQRRALLYAGLAMAAFTVARLPRVGVRARLRLARPRGGFDTQWTEAAALQATSFACIPGTVGAIRSALRDSLRVAPLDVSRIAIPSLVVSGARDTIIPPRDAARLAAALPHARYRLLDDAMHDLPTDRPEQIARLIVAEVAAASA